MKKNRIYHTQACFWWALSRPAVNQIVIWTARKVTTTCPSTLMLLTHRESNPAWTRKRFSLPKRKMRLKNWDALLKRKQTVHLRWESRIKICARSPSQRISRRQRRLWDRTHLKTVRGKVFLGWKRRATLLQRLKGRWAWWEPLWPVRSVIKRKVEDPGALPWNRNPIIQVSWAAMRISSRQTKG